MRLPLFLGTAFFPVLVAVCVPLWQGASAHATSASHASRIHARRTVPLDHRASRGGSAGLGQGQLLNSGGPVLPHPALYLILWGSQWADDPNQMAPLLTGFLSGLGGSAWNQTDVQYGAGNQPNMLAGIWGDGGAEAPSAPSLGDIEAESVRAAAHFGNATVAQNRNAVYVVATAHGQNDPAFGTQYCGIHGNDQTAQGDIKYIEQSYSPDAGVSCGAGTVTGAPTDGATIILGHEVAETETDPDGNAWHDAAGYENGDKCAWTGLGTVQFPTGTFAVQPIWSNAARDCLLETTVPVPAPSPSPTTTPAVTPTATVTPTPRPTSTPTIPPPPPPPTLTPTPTPHKHHHRRQHGRGAPLPN